MKIVSWNVNGYRSIWKKNFEDSILQIKPDILCLQETKLQNVEDGKKIKGYNSFWNCSDVSGTAGVGFYVKETIPILRIQSPVNGRLHILETEKISILNVYAPCNNEKYMRTEEQYIFFETVLKTVRKMLWQKKQVCLCGDFNVPLTENDLSNTDYHVDAFNSENLAGMKEILALGFVDVYRKFFPLAREYTWYKNGKVESKIGSRLDYFILHGSLLNCVLAIGNLNQYFGSDHIPIYLNLHL